MAYDIRPDVAREGKLPGDSSMLRKDGRAFFWGGAVTEENEKKLEELVRKANAYDQEHPEEVGFGEIGERPPVSPVLRRRGNSRGFDSIGRD